MSRLLVEIVVAPIALAFLVQTASAQAESTDRERVYIVADSLDWMLTYHTFPGSRTVACEVATRVQPGAVFRRFWEDQRTFTVALMETTALIDSFVIQVDAKPPVVRKPTREERNLNVLHLHGSQGPVFVDAATSRMRIQAFYPRREKQDLELDLTGFVPLYWRAMQFDCLPFERAYTKPEFKHVPHRDTVAPSRLPFSNR